MDLYEWFIRVGGIAAFGLGWWGRARYDEWRAERREAKAPKLPAAPPPTSRLTDSAARPLRSSSMSVRPSWQPEAEERARVQKLVTPTPPPDAPQERTHVDVFAEARRARKMKEVRDRALMGMAGAEIAADPYSGFRERALKVLRSHE